MLADADDFDFGSDSSSGSDDNQGGWDDDDNAAVPAAPGEELVDSWEDAPDYEEIERKKKEEEEKKQREEAEAAEAERKRKELKKLNKEKAKLIKQNLERQDSSDDEGGLFDVDVDLVKADQEKKDFELAVDALGLGDEKVTVDDYMNFVPETIGDFDGLRQKLVSVILEKINLKAKEAPQQIGLIIRGIIDDYKAKQIKDLNTFLIKLCNDKLQEQRKKLGKKDKKASTTKAFANTKDDDFDDFM